MFLEEETMNWLCRIGLHKIIGYEADGVTPMGWLIQIGRTYINKCERCGAKERSFVLTRDML